MDFLFNHFGYIAITLVTGVIIGWATFPMAQTVIKSITKRKA